jgi:hypothetical protein
MYIHIIRKWHTELNSLIFTEEQVILPNTDNNLQRIWYQLQGLVCKLNKNIILRGQKHSEPVIKELPYFLVCKMHNGLGS